MSDFAIRKGPSGPLAGGTPGYFWTVGADGQSVTLVPPGVVGGVTSWNGRVGAVVPVANDYKASQVQNDSTVTGAEVSDALDTLKAASGVSSFNTRTGAVVPAGGDYTTTQVTNASSVTGGTDTDALNTLLAATQAYVIRASLADLVASDLAALPNGCRAYVVDQAETYTLDTGNAFAAFSPLIIARIVGTGRWFKRSKAFVVANYTLWVAAFNTKNYALGYTPGQLLATGTVQADIVLQSTDNSNSSLCCVVDGNGNLWWDIGGGVAGHAIHKIALLDTLQTGTPTPAVDLNAGAATCVCHAFDKWNNLWCSVGAAAFRKYGAAQYAVSGTPTPPIIVQPTFVTGGEDFIFFDDSNNLWFSSNSQSSISMLADSQLRTSSTNTERPSVIFSGANIVSAGGIAMGPLGLLWYVNYAAGAGTVKAFDPTSPTSGNPAIVINLTSASFNGAWDLAFDRLGGLWVLNFDNGHLLHFTAASIAASGAVVPDVDITITTPTGAVSAAAEGLNFSYNPNRSGLLPSGGPPV